MTARNEEGGGCGSTFVGHEPCPVCLARGRDRDSDNMARYDDGHGYCFVCGHYESGRTGNMAGERKKERGAGRAFIPLKGEAMPLSARKLSRETCALFDYEVGRQADGTPCQIASYRSGDNGTDVVAQHVRMPGKQFRWRGDASARLQLYGQHLWKPGGKRVVVTEGEIDCLTVSQLQGNRWPVVSLPNGASAAVKAFMNNLEWLESFGTVVLAFDMDEPGRKACRDCAALLSPGKALIAELPAKDANEALLAGKTRELMDALWNARPWRPDGILSGADLWEDVRTPPPRGYEVPWPRMNDMLQGFRLGELYLFTAGSGIGKSTLVHELAHVFHLHHGLPLGILALEENPRRTALRHLSLYLDRPLHLPDVLTAVPEEELRKAFDAVLAYDWHIYRHFGSSNIDGLLSRIRYMAVALGCKVVVLDHISIVVSGLDTGAAEGESERKTIDLLMTRLRSLIEELNIMVLAVSHLKRPEKGQSYNEGRAVRLTDLRGSGALEQLSDVVISLERDQQGEEPNRSLVRVLKNRPTGVTGPADVAIYTPETGRLTAADEETATGAGEAERHGFEKEQDESTTDF